MSARHSGSKGNAASRRASKPRSVSSPGRRAGGPSGLGVLTARYERAALIIPKADLNGDPSVTSSEAVVGRAARQSFVAETPQLRVPHKEAAGALRKIGLGELDAHQKTREPAAAKGMFTRLGSIGATAAFFGSSDDEDDAKSELANEYVFVDDFELEAPTPIKASTSSAARGQASLDRREWPEESGVAAAHARGIKGAGVLVGVLDTGIDADHQEFEDHTVTYRYVSLHPSLPYWPPRDVRGFDTEGHGTHVSGIVAGSTVGVAPEASLYVASVIESETTRTSLLRVASGLDWILRQFRRPDNEHRPGVLNMSLGFSSDMRQEMTQQEFDDRLRVMRALLRNLYRANVIPIVAVGNDGPGQYGYPAGFSDVLAIGAVDFGHEVADFSGSGDPPGEELSKPDLMGYGVGVYSSLERDYAGRSVYQRLDGTSMATPFVAGIAALYRCQRPAMSADDIWNRLLETAMQLDGTDAVRVGDGLARFVL